MKNQIHELKVSEFLLFYGSAITFLGFVALFLDNPYLPPLLIIIGGVIFPAVIGFGLRKMASSSEREEIEFHRGLDSSTSPEAYVMEGLLRLAAPCISSRHTKAGHSASSCGRCGGSMIDPRRAKEILPDIHYWVEEAIKLKGEKEPRESERV